MLCFLTHPTNNKKQYFDHSQVTGIDAAQSGTGTVVTLSNGLKAESATAAATIATNIARAPFDTSQVPINCG